MLKFTFATALLLVVGPSVAVCRAEDKIPLDMVPAKITAAVKEWFPKGEITSVTKETEDGKVVYDVELKQQDKKFEMDIQEDGTVVEIEREIAAKDLPEVCAKAIEAKYPKSTLKEVMQVNKVEGKKETLHQYEVTLETAEKKSVEVVVSIDGKIVE